MSPQSNQFVLTIPNESVDCLYQRPAFHADEHSMRILVEAIADSGRYTDRAFAEDSREIKQVVACALVHHGNRLLCLRRAKRSNRASLRMKLTLLVGGHVDQQDALGPGTLERCASRELAEELGVQLGPSQLKPFGVVTDPTLSSAGWLHVGVVFLAEIDSSHISLGSRHDTSEFVYAKRPQVVKLIDASEVASSVAQLDAWSYLVASSEALGQMFQVNVPNVQDFFRYA